MLFKITLRNILRNRRRSGMTVVAVALGAVAMLLFGAFMASLVLGFKSSTIAAGGHLSIYRHGYRDYGSGNPGGYSIAGYDALIDRIRNDPQIGPAIAVATPVVALTGIAGNFAVDRSRTFFGEGFIPSDRDRMAAWDEYGVRKGRGVRHDGMTDADAQAGTIGSGLARVLGLCADFHLADCPPAQPAVLPVKLATPAADIAGLSALEAANAPDKPARPHIDLLAATAGGAPNVVTMTVASVSVQPLKAADDAYIGMPLPLAQSLLFGRGGRAATAIVVQLHHTADMDSVRGRLEQMFTQMGADLEIRDFIQETPFYLQLIGMFGAILLFITVIMGVIVLFSVANTMSMSVIERTSEIGTIRSLGVQRGGVRAQFLAEGTMLGVIGASLGVLVAIGLSITANHSGLTWTPPGQTYAVPLRLQIGAIPELVVASWIGLILLSALAAVLPANAAARKPIVDALRHV